MTLPSLPAAAPPPARTADQVRGLMRGDLFRLFSTPTGLISTVMPIYKAFADPWHPGEPPTLLLELTQGVLERERRRNVKPKLRDKTAPQRHRRVVRKLAEFEARTRYYLELGGIRPTWSDDEADYGDPDNGSNPA